MDGMLLRMLAAGETTESVVELAGIRSAPGTRTEKSQHCRLVWTSRKRLVFLQAGHSAELGLSASDLCHSICPCPRTVSSMRKFEAYAGVVDASQILEVFVHQVDMTTYVRTIDICCGPICKGDCSFGGVLRSRKTVDELAKTLDFDDLEEGTEQKQRVMMHSLIIRYLNVATNSVEETVAVAAPDVDVGSLYQLAADLQAAKTVTVEQWLGLKAYPG
ncbi:unnamed protein product [Phaeothamnion confervicola]